MKQFIRKEGDYWTALHEVWEVLEYTSILGEYSDKEKKLTYDDHMETLSEALTELAAWRKKYNEVIDAEARAKIAISESGMKDTEILGLKMKLYIEEDHFEALQENREFNYISEKFGVEAALNRVREEDIDRIMREEREVIA